MGLALAAAWLAGLSACVSSETGPGAPDGGADGLTAVFLTDDPFPFDLVERVDVHVVEIALSPQADTAAGAPAWITVATPDRAFDLLDLQNGATALLGESDLPAGQYRAVRVLFDPSRSGMTDTEGHRIGTATGPGAPGIDWQAKGDAPLLFGLVEEPLVIDDNGGDVVIDFDVGRSFLYDGAGRFTFMPNLRAITRSGSGAIAGSLHHTDGTPIPRAVVSIHYAIDSTIGAGPVLATSRSDAEGRFTAAFLRPGSYQVVPTDLARDVEGPVRRVTVKAGETVDVGELSF